MSRPIRPAYALILCALAGVLAAHLSTTQSVAATEEVAGQHVEKALADQAEAWNRGDFESFVSIYADDVTFLSPSGLTQGREQVLKRYQKKYPDPASRGVLSFEIVEVRQATSSDRSTGAPVDVRGMSVVARWMLRYEDRDDA
ncbi:MAG: nuclear transport factor 2 family protein, partial [Thermoanaerobaculia bacterium]|nr:nuclear transport factor 2 family protein [Thermoanaerobaculia bacterium]